MEIVPEWQLYVLKAKAAGLSRDKAAALSESQNNHY
jgi:hypothetical protein